MNVALEVLPSLRVDYLLASVKYVLKSSASLNNWPMVTIILLSSICCPTSSLISREMGVGDTSRCSIEDGNPAHSVDQNGFGIVATFVLHVFFTLLWLLDNFYHWLLELLFFLPILGFLPFERFFLLDGYLLMCFTPNCDNHHNINGGFFIFFSLAPPLICGIVFSSLPFLGSPLSMGN